MPDSLLTNYYHFNTEPEEGRLRNVYCVWRSVSAIATVAYKTVTKQLECLTFPSARTLWVSLLPQLLLITFHTTFPLTVLLLLFCSLPCSFEVQLGEDVQNRAIMLLTHQLPSMLQHGSEYYFIGNGSYYSHVSEQSLTKGIIPYFYAKVITSC